MAWKKVRKLPLPLVLNFNNPCNFYRAARSLMAIGLQTQNAGIKKLALNTFLTKNCF
jgi:hypothetical protein